MKLRSIVGLLMVTVVAVGACRSTPCVTCPEEDDKRATASPTPSPTPTPTPTAPPTTPPRTPPPTPPPNPNAQITFRSTSCSCVVGQIRNYVDGGHKGSMACNQQQTYTVPAGRHELEARDDSGRWGPTSRDFTGGDRHTLQLTCSAGGNAARHEARYDVVRTEVENGK
jgi:hypothetical protein